MKRMRPHVILAVLQNAWGADPAGWEAVYARMSLEQRRRFKARALFGGCLTGRRLRRAFGWEMCKSIAWENASPRIGGHAASAFPADPVHIQAVLDDVHPDLVLAFGRVAETALRRLWHGPLLAFPHPAARMLDVADLDSWSSRLEAVLDTLGRGNPAFERERT